MGDPWPLSVSVQKIIQRLFRQSALRLDRILFIPAARPPHKRDVQITPFADRYRMVELACENEPSFEPSRLEETEPISYSIDTVHHLQRSEPGSDLYFLIGADAFEEIESWHRWKELVAAVTFIVVSRPGAEFHVAPGAQVHRITGLHLTVSSTQIREQLKDGAPVHELPEKVEAYIRAQHLYGT